MLSKEAIVNHDVNLLSVFKIETIINEIGFEVKNLNNSEHEDSSIIKNKYKEEYITYIKKKLIISLIFNILL